METLKFDGDRARQSIEESLKALGVASVDLLHLHDPEYASDLNDVTKKGGAIDALFKMKEQGLCKAVGLAAGRTDIMMPLLRDFDFDALISHNRFTLLNREATAMFELAQLRNIAIINAAPYASGILAKGASKAPLFAYMPAGDDIKSRANAIEAICAKHGVPMGAAAALQFSMNAPRVCCIHNLRRFLTGRVCNRPSIGPISPFPTPCGRNWSQFPSTWTTRKPSASTARADWVQAVCALAGTTALPCCEGLTSLRLK